MTIVEACESKTNTTPEFPMGWYSVARSHELLIGEVKPVQAFDRELVLYRTRSGLPVLQDAYCPHLGAHLGYSPELSVKDTDGSKGEIVRKFDPDIERLIMTPPMAGG
jgi:hypothetical protein